MKLFITYIKEPLLWTGYILFVLVPGIAGEINGVHLTFGLLVDASAFYFLLFVVVTYLLRDQRND